MMKSTFLPILTSFIFLLQPFCARAADITAEAEGGAVLYGRWLLGAIEAIEKDMDAITSAAEKAAEHYIQQRHVIKAEGDPSAVGEVTGRSGGVVMMGLTMAARAGGKPLIIYILRELNFDEDAAALKRHHQNGSHVVVFGRTSLLERLKENEVPFSSFVDIHAAAGGGLFTDADGQPVVSTVTTANAVALWTWFSELIAACTRLEEIPPLYEGYHVPGGKHRALRLTGVRFHENAAVTPIPPGTAGRFYLRKLREEIESLLEDEMPAIRHVSNLAAGRLSGKMNGKVYSFLHGHSILRHGPVAYDPGHFEQINKGWTRMRDDVTLQRDDLVLCIGYNELFRGKNFGDWEKQARDAGTVLAWSIATFLRDELDAIHPEATLIRQPWSFGDAVVRIPGYDVNMSPTSGVLAEAVYWMTVADVHQRLQNEAPQDSRTDDLRKRTPLHRAVVSNNIDEVRRILGDSPQLGAADYLGMTPLHLAAQIARPEILKMILETDADVNTQDRFGRTPLHLAVSSNRLPIVKLLLGASADPAAKDGVGETPLHRAVRADNPAIARNLLAVGKADQIVDIRDALRSRTALHLAAAAGNQNVVQVLLKASAQPEAADRWEMQPIHLAAMTGNFEIMSRLIDAGAAPMARDLWGRFPLHWAAQEHNLDAIEFFIARGLDPDVRDQYGRTPLFDAAGVSADKPTLTLLLNAGADPAVTDQRGAPPTVGTWGWVAKLLQEYADNDDADEVQEGKDN